MAKAEWLELLTNWSREIIENNLYPHEETYLDNPPLPESLWLGFAGATEAEVLLAEERLATKLPPSYREFLSISNGWLRLNHFIYDLLPVSKVDWFRLEHQSLIDIWIEGDFPVSDEDYFVYGKEQNEHFIRAKYMQSSLQLNSEGNSAYILLNSEIVTPEGEWEAWFFAEWLPGARRYKSFWELMKGEHESFLVVLNYPG